MSEFTDGYVDLLIKQYWDKPNARAEIAAQSATWETVRDVIADFGNVFDLDKATGDQLNIIGKIVGLPRDRVEFDLDEDYLFYLRIKIAKNSGSAYIVSDDRTSIQDVIQFAFNGLAYVIDNKTMAMTLYLLPGIDPVKVSFAVQLDLLPKPQGVRYIIIEAAPGVNFGFDTNISALGFGRKNISGVTEGGGLLAREVFV